jgi:hypothetical protein
MTFISRVMRHWHKYVINYLSRQHTNGLFYLAPRSTHLHNSARRYFQWQHAKLMSPFLFTLCHVYAKATRSVLIPAPVYCEFRHNQNLVSITLALRITLLNHRNHCKFYSTISCTFIILILILFSNGVGQVTIIILYHILILNCHSLLAI